MHKPPLDLYMFTDDSYGVGDEIRSISLSGIKLVHLAAFKLNIQLDVEGSDPLRQNGKRQVGD